MLILLHQINAAHEILSDARLRADYDSAPSTPDSGPSTHFYNFDEADGFGAFGFAEDYVNGSFYTESNPHGRRNRSPRSGGFYSFYASSGHFAYQAEMERQAAEEKLRNQQRAEQRARERADQQERYEKAMAAKAALAEKKRQEELAEQRARDKAFQDELHQMEEIWKSNDATTPAEKRKWCLHSFFWPRQLGKSKYKCMRCEKKRGPSGFKCPHCGLLQCQACLDKFTTERAYA